MQSSTTKGIIIFIAGLAIGAASMAILQVQQTPKNPPVASTTPPANTPAPATQPQGPIESAKDILIHPDAVGGRVEKIENDLITITMIDFSTESPKTTDQQRTVRMFDDTQFTDQNGKSASKNDITAGANLEATGLYDENGVLLSNAMVIRKK